jgi:hypothetical protein
MVAPRGYRIRRQPLAGKPAAFFFQGRPEIYEPNILNPGENMRVVLRLSSGASENTTNLMTVVTASGARSEITFGW